MKALKLSTILLCATIIFLPACGKDDAAEAEFGFTPAPGVDQVLSNDSLSDPPVKISPVGLPTENAFPSSAENKEKLSPPTGKSDKKKKEVLVIGKTLKTGMSLESALSKLGIPRSIKINRGTEPERDSISVEYLNHGLRIHALTQNSRIEELEVLPEFRGKFFEGAKIGSKFPELIKSFGIPDSKDSSIAKYPDRGMYIFLKNDSMISVKLFAKNSKLLDHELLIN